MTSSPRLLFVAPSAYPLGGVQTWLDYLLPGLAAKGWEPVLGLAAGSFHDVETYVQTHPGLNSVTIDNATGSREGRIRALLRAMRQLKPDIAAVVNIPDAYVAASRLRAGGAGSPRMVMTIHGIQPDLYEDARFYRGVLDGVVCTNELAVRLAVEHGLGASRVHYAPYGVEVPAEVRSNDPSRRRPLRIAYVGRFEQWQKRVSDLIGIVGALDQRGVDFELLIAGAGPDEAVLRQGLARFEAAQRVRFLGNLSSTALAVQVYSIVDVLLLTSSWETGPIVIWEAMAHGVAVLSSRYTGAGLEGSLRDEWNCLTFPVGGVEQAASGLARLADPVLRQRLVHGGYELVRSRYTRERSVQSWDRCFRSVLEAPPLPAPGERFSVTPAGRLDRLFGPSMGETLRRGLGIRFRHTEPGGEWPHSYGERANDDPEFWRLATELDSHAAAASARGA